MLSVFNKKRHFVDLLKDYVDMHCHIIHGIDDGAKNLYESYHLIKRAMEMGISGFIATPHIMSDMYPNTPQTICLQYDELKKHLEEKKLAPSVFKTAAEYMVDADFEKLLENKNLLLLTDKYVLIELPFIQVPMNIEFIIDKLIANDYIPILAHPERYRYFHQQPKILKVLKEKGCLFQLNALSLSTYYGNSIHRAALNLLEDGAVSFLGTDIHNQLHLNKLSEMLLTKKLEKMVVPVIDHTKEVFG